MTAGTTERCVGMKEFFYTNDVGVRKRLVVNSVSDDGMCSVTLWSADHGEYCGSGRMTVRELDNFLAHYGAEDQLNGTRW